MNGLFFVDKESNNFLIGEFGFYDWVDNKVCTVYFDFHFEIPPCSTIKVKIA